MSQRQPGRITKLNPLLIKVEFDPDKLAAGRGAPHTYYTAKNITIGRLDTRNATPSSLPTTTGGAVIIGPRRENKFNPA